MSERKVLNKYYPIDYDPRRLPRQKGVGSIEDKIMVIRTMAPFHMRCKTCGKNLEIITVVDFSIFRKLHLPRDQIQLARRNSQRRKVLGNDSD